MQATPTIVPISSLVRNPNTYLEALGEGPVFLTQRSNTAAVLVSSAEWDAIAYRLQFLEQDRRNRIADVQFAQMRGGVEGEDYFVLEPETA